MNERFHRLLFNWHAWTNTNVYIDRVIECFDPRPDSRTIWADIFLTNLAHEEQPIYLLHRGNLIGNDVTMASWSAAANGSREHQLTDIVKAVRHRSDMQSPTDPTSLNVAASSLEPGGEQITVSEQGVCLGEQTYSLWQQPMGLARLAGTDEDEDVPYTMWELHGLHTSPRTIIRLKAEMTTSTYEKQIGVEGAFEAYGEELLLDKIDCEDLLYYRGPAADRYRELFRVFTAGTHLVPKVFEYLVVAPGWKAQRLSLASGSYPQECD